MILITLKKVFTHTSYSILAIAISLVTFMLTILLPNIALITQIFQSSTISLSEKLGIVGHLLAGIGTNFSLFSASYTIALAVLFGVNIALITYYIRRKKEALNASGVATGIGGLFTGVLGVGCAACGTLILAPLLTLIGAGWVLTLLPLHGQEFGILAIILLVFSIYLTSKTIQAPNVCDVAPQE